MQAEGDGWLGTLFPDHWDNTLAKGVVVRSALI